MPMRQNVRCHDVEAFYGVLDLTDGSRLQEPTLQTGTDTAVFFVHGYNVDRSAAEVWFQEIFKRLWQSGMNAQLPNYYVNVENAFASAGPFAEALRKTTGRKVVMAHSLGNMVVSSAIQDHGAPVDVYFMLNSAVPAEAYDTDAPTYDFSIEDVPEGLIHDDWATGTLIRRRVTQPCGIATFYRMRDLCPMRQMRPGRNSLGRGVSKT